MSAAAPLCPPLAPWLVAQLQQLLAQRGHAWLLQGPSGLGQFDLALALARAWLCDAPTLPAARGSLPPEGASAALGRPGGGADAPTLPAARGSLPPEGASTALGRPGGGADAPALPAARGWLPPEGASAALGRPGGGADAPAPVGACGRCASCHGIDVHAHADLMVLMPETHMLERGWPLPEKAQTELDEKKRKPSKDIRVEAMREAIEFAQRTSARGRGLVVLVYPAQRMNAITANALLKTLEEPPGNARFILASDAAHLLLPTIRSRCQTHAMTWPAQADALAWLQRQPGDGAATASAAALLQAAGGRPQGAQRLAALGVDARTWAALPQQLAQGQAGVLAGLGAADAIDALHKLCHDLLARAVDAPPRFFAAADLPPGAANLVALSAWSRQLGQAMKTAEHPYHAELRLDALIEHARQALRG